MNDKYKKFIFKYKFLLLGLMLVPTLLIIFAFDPAHTRFFPPCHFKLITGFECPGCGSLRAIHQLLNGNFLAAIRLNPLMIIFLFIFFLVLISLLIKNKFTKSFLSFLSRPYIPLAVLIIILVYWLLRNLPFYPFTLLGP